MENPTEQAKIEDSVDEHEKEAIEKLKNAEWSPSHASKQHDGFDDKTYPAEPSRKRIVHQKKGDTVHSNLNRNQRATTEKNKNRNIQK
jgi:hypothetical protein